MTSHPAPNAVDAALKMPRAAEFEKALTARLEAEREAVVAVVDLDGFLHVNEGFGIEAGDAVIVGTGAFLRDAFKGEADVFRSGGDEFALLFADGLEKETAFLRLDEARRAYMLKRPDGVRQTLTAGVASSFDDAGDLRELVRKAESAMVRGKRAGGDRVCLAREEKMVTKTAHYTAEQLQRLTKVSRRAGLGEAILLREALDLLLKKYDG